MRYHRRFFVPALLILYLGRVMCGEALHFVECSATHSSCTHNTHTDSNTKKPQPCSPCCPNDGDTESRDQNPDTPHSHHDSANCSVCQVLGQAQTQATVIELPASAEPASAIIATTPVLYLLRARTTMQPRAPPASA